MSWQRFLPYGPVLYRYGPFTLRPLIPPAHHDTGRYGITVLQVSLRRDVEIDLGLGTLNRLTPTVHDLLTFVDEWVTRKDREIASLEGILAENLEEPAKGDAEEDKRDEPKYDEAALQFWRKQLEYLRPEVAAVRLERGRLRDLVDQGQSIPNTSSNLVAEVIDPRTLTPSPFDTISTRYILELPAFGEMHQVTSAEPVLGEEIARFGRFHIVRHLGYRIVGRPYLFSDPEPGLWPPPTQDQLRQGLSMRLDTTDGRHFVLFEGWSDGDFSLSALLACVDEWFEQQEGGQEMRRRAMEKFQAHGATNEEIQRMSAADSQRDTFYQEVLLARKEVVGDP